MVPTKTTRVLVLLNAKSGTLANSDAGDEAKRIADGFAAHGVTADVKFLNPAEAARELEAGRRAGCTAVVVGGGDGTIHTVANAVAGTEMIFGVLPLGTHNHFAKELGVSDDLPAAVDALGRALAAGDGVGPIDVAELNGQLFLNFSGVGLHPRVVEDREGEHERIKRVPLARTLLRKFTKPLALLVAFIRALGSLPILRLVVEADGRRLSRITPSLVVGNNVHQMAVFGIGEVSVLRRDVLNVYIARTTSVPQVIRLALAAAFKRLSANRHFESVPCQTLTIRYRRPTLKVTMDGEVMRLRTPLEYRIRKAALTVVRPGGPATVGDAAAAAAE
ncbi:MAG: sphingosine kinase [Phycisphaerales bacterium]|nr:sphingosine kinase [Phycisphaerales bacterium]